MRLPPSTLTLARARANTVSARTHSRNRWGWLGGISNRQKIGDSRKDVQTRSTVGLGHCDAHQAELAHLFDRRGWEPVFLVNFGLAEKADL